MGVQTILCQEDVQHLTQKVSNQIEIKYDQESGQVELQEKRGRQAYFAAKKTVQALTAGIELATLLLRADTSEANLLVFGPPRSGKSKVLIETAQNCCDGLFRAVQTPKQNKDKKGKKEKRKGEESDAYIAEISMLHVYCEKMTDLLNPSQSHTLKLRHSSLLGSYVDNLSTHPCRSSEALRKLMEAGLSTRAALLHSRALLHNASHLLITLQVRRRSEEAIGLILGTVRLMEIGGFEYAVEELPSSESSVTFASSNASLGSQTIDSPQHILRTVASSVTYRTKGRTETPGNARRTKKMTSTVNDRLEKKSIAGRSLKAFRHCIACMGKSTPHHKIPVPYRASTVTYIMKNMLKIDSFTAFVACLNPQMNTFDESVKALKTLDQAGRISGENSGLKPLLSLAEKEGVLQNELDRLTKSVERIQEEMKPDIDLGPMAGSPGKPRPVSPSQAPSFLSKSPKTEQSNPLLFLLNERIASIQKLLESSQLTLEEREALSSSQSGDRGNWILRQLPTIKRGYNGLRPEQYHLSLLSPEEPLSGKLVFPLRRYADTVIGRKTKVKEAYGIRSKLETHIGIDVSSLMPKHCSLLHTEDGQLLCTSLNEYARVFVNGEQVREVPAKVCCPGDVLVIGNILAFVLGQGPKPPPQPLPHWERVVLETVRPDVLEKHMGLVPPFTTLVTKMEQKYDGLPKIILQHHALKEEYEKQKEELVFEMCLAQILVDEANAMAADMDKDAMFEHTLKERYEGALLDHLQFVITMQPANNPSFHNLSLRACLTVWIRVRFLVEGEPPDLWTFTKFLRRIELMRNMYASFLRFEADHELLKKMFPLDIDPFYEPPLDALVGVGYIYLDSITYMMEIHQRTTLVSFKGHEVGEVEFSVKPILKLPHDPTKIPSPYHEKDLYEPMEVNLNNYIGETVRMNFTVRMLHDLPPQRIDRAFVSFKFFLQETPMTTCRCGKKSVNPEFHETLGVDQIVTEDFISYLSERALELEVWAQAENAATGPLIVEEPVGDELSDGEEGDQTMDQSIGGFTLDTAETEGVNVSEVMEKLEDAEREIRVHRETAEQREALFKKEIEKLEQKLSEIVKASEVQKKDFEEKETKLRQDFENDKLKQHQQAEELRKRAEEAENKSQACNIF